MSLGDQKTDEATSDPPKPEPAKPSKKARRDKPVRKEVVLQTAENSDDEHPDREETAEPIDKQAADFGSAGEWPVDSKNDSAGAPVRKAPDVEKKEKKESKKRPKKSKDQKPEIKDQSDEGKKEKEKEKEKEKMQQTPSSDNNDKVPEKVSEGDCTTKRNLHLIKTERDRKSSEEETEYEKERRRNKRRSVKKKKRTKKSKKSKKKKKLSRRKIEGEGEKKASSRGRKKKVELASIHVDKVEPARPPVERAAIKSEGWRDVERESPYTIVTHYDNLPEDSIMRAMKPPPVEPNSNPFAPSASAQYVNLPGTSTTMTTEHEKKAATEPEKKEQISIGTAEGAEVTINPQPKEREFSLKKSFQNPPCFLWIVLAVLFVLCFGLSIAIIVQHNGYQQQAQELRELKQRVGALE